MKTSPMARSLSPVCNQLSLRRRARFPNDVINYAVASPVVSATARNTWLFQLSIGSVGANAECTEVILRIVGADVYLKDPSRIGVKIRE
jgi:hypothetical protein